MNSVSEFNKQPKAVNAGSGNVIIESKSVNLINLNQLLETSLELYQDSISKSAPVIRCDNLPVVNGDPVQMLKLFNLLLKMVLLNLPGTCNSFVYVKCGVDKEDLIDMTLEDNFTNFIISVYSNTIHIREWVNGFQQELNECKAICQKLNGSFQEHVSSETGCLFSLKLPGKIN